MFVIVVVTTIDKTSRTQPAAQRIRFNISKTQLNSTRGEADARETMMIIITISRANLIFKMRMIRSDGGCRSTAGVELCHYNRYFQQRITSVWKIRLSVGMLSYAEEPILKAIIKILLKIRENVFFVVISPDHIICDQMVPSIDYDNISYAIHSYIYTNIFLNHLSYY